VKPYADIPPTDQISRDYSFVEIWNYPIAPYPAPTTPATNATANMTQASDSELSWSIIAAIVGSVIAALLVHSFVFVRVKALKVADSKGWIITSVLCGPLVWLIWSVREAARKRSSKVFSNPDITVSYFAFCFGSCS
jgi:hypothetical protein